MKQKKFKIGDIVRVSKKYCSIIETYLGDDDLEDEIRYVDIRIDRQNEFRVTHINESSYKKCFEYKCETLDRKDTVGEDEWGDEEEIEYCDFHFDEPYLELVRKNIKYLQYLK